MSYWLSNYAVQIITAIFACFAAVWAISSFFYGKRWGGLTKTRRSTQSLLVSLLVGIPSGWTYADATLVDQRSEIIQQVYAFRQDVIQQENRTRLGWQEDGYGLSLPSVVPWPLLIEQNEWRVWTTKSAGIQVRISRKFSPSTSKTCAKVHMHLLGPRPATLEAEGKNRIIAHASWSRADLKQFYGAIDHCLAALQSGQIL